MQQRRDPRARQDRRVTTSNTTADGARLSGVEGMARFLVSVVLGVTLAACTAAAVDPHTSPDPRPTFAEVPPGMSENEAIQRGLVQGDHVALVDHAFTLRDAHHLRLRNVGYADDTFELRFEPADAGTVEPARSDLVAGQVVTIIVAQDAPGELVVFSRGATARDGDGELLRIPMPPEDT